MNLAIAAAVFPLIFLGELPDKTMFASLILATRGRPLAVWTGSVIAFAVHVVIAVAIGVALFKLVPHRYLDLVVGALFLGGAVYSWKERDEGAGHQVRGDWSSRSALVTSAGVIFLAEWGDLTQILTANLAARYHDALSVGVASLVALALVAAIAVAAGVRLLRYISVRTLRVATAVILLALAGYTFVQAAS